MQPGKDGIGAKPGHHEHLKPSTKLPTDASGWRSRVRISIAFACPTTWTIDIEPRRSGNDGAPDGWRPQRRQLGVLALNNAQCASLVSEFGGLDRPSSTARFLIRSATLGPLLGSCCSGMVGPTLRGHRRCTAIRRQASTLYSSAAFWTASSASTAWTLA